MREGSGIGLGIGLATIAFFALLPFVFAVGIYVLITVYAIVKGSAFEAGTVNVGALLAGIATLVALLVALLGAGIGLVGKGLARGRAKGDAGGRRGRARARL